MHIVRKSPIAIVHAADVTVTVDTGQVIGTNNLSIGFTLDGQSVSYWRGSSTAQSYSQTNNYKMSRIFDHRLGNPCTYWNEGTKTGTWDWSKYDDLIDDLIAVGIEPMICLGYYSDYGSNDFFSSGPSGMTRNWAGTYLPDPDQYKEYARDWVEHFPEITYYEILNEAYKHYGWGGTNTARLGYFKTFFNAVVTEMRDADASIKVGNDASMMTTNDHGEWWANNIVDLDFLSWHAYFTGTTTSTDAYLINKAQYDEGALYGGNDFIDPARQTYYDIKGIWLEVICSEENLSWAWDPADIRCIQMLNAVTEALRYRTYILNGHVTHTMYWEFAGSSGYYLKLVNRANNYRYYPYWLHNIMFSDELGALSVDDDILTSSSTSSSVVPLVWKHEDTTNILLIHSSTSSHSVALSGVSGTYSFAKINNDNSAIQSGSMDVSNEITFDDYTVMLLQQESGGEPDNPPSYSDISHNTTIAGNPVEFSCNWADDNGLSGYIFSTNNTGSWQNETFASLTGTQDWANVTKTLNSTSNVVVQYRWYCNDSANQWATTPIASLVTEAASNIPVYSNAGTTSNINGSSCKFFVKWIDIEGLSGFIFGTNNTGSWVNETWFSLSGVEDWSEVTKTLNETVGTLIQWQVWCNDTDNHWTATDEFFLITEEEFTETLLFFETKTLLDINTELEDDGYPFLIDSNGTITLLTYSFPEGDDSFQLNFNVSSIGSTSYTKINAVTKGSPSKVYFDGIPQTKYDTWNYTGNIITVITSGTDVEILWIQEPPILFFPFTEGTGTVAHDVSGNDHHGTLYSGASWAEEPYSAVYFDGDNDYVKTASSEQLNFSDEVTVICYVQLMGENTGNHEPAVSIGWGDADERLTFVARRSNGHLAYWDYNNGWKESAFTLNRDVYYQLAWTAKSKENITFYVNGEKVTHLNYTQQSATPESDDWVPQGLAYSDGYFYFSGVNDIGGSKVWKLNATFGVEDYFIMPDEAKHTSGLVVGDDGYLYAADYSSDKIYKIAMNTSFPSHSADVVDNFTTWLEGTSALCFADHLGLSRMLVSDYANTKKTYVVDYQSSFSTGSMVSIADYTNNGWSQGLCYYNGLVYESGASMWGFDLDAAVEAGSVLSIEITERGYQPPSPEDITFDGTNMWITSEAIGNRSFFIYDHNIIESSQTLDSDFPPQEGSVGVGSTEYGVEKLRGIIDEVKIYNYSFTDDEIYAEFHNSQNYDVDITDMEGCGNWVFAEEKYYTFQTKYRDSDSYEDLDTCKFAFTDGVSWVNASYDVSANEYTLESGADIARLKDGSITIADANLLQVTFLIYFKNRVLDAYNVDIWMWCNDTTGATTGWQILAMDYFNIYNLGGHSTLTSSGDAGRSIGGDVFDLYAYNNSWVDVSMIFRDLQHVKMLPLITYTNELAILNWSLTFYMDYCVGDSDTWVKGLKCVLHPPCFINYRRTTKRLLLSNDR